MSELRFDGKVVVVTGAGGGLGKEYALFYASRGAKVVVNDLGGSVKEYALFYASRGAKVVVNDLGGSVKEYALFYASRGAKVVVNDLGGSVKGEGNSKSADVVTAEIKKNGGIAVANYDSVEFGEKIINTAIENFGKIDILINNAGILRDVSFVKMKEVDWDLIMKVHLKGAFAVTNAAWSHMRKQKFGRIINTASGSGVYGSFGQANYSAAKLGLHGFTNTLAKEGEKYNIFTNSIAPIAGTRMTESVFPKEIIGALHAKYVVPLVAFLTHDSTTENGGLFEIGGGWMAKIRFQRGEGAYFNLPFSPEEVRDNWNQVTSFKEPTYPNSNMDGMNAMMKDIDKRMQGNKTAAGLEPLGPSNLKSSTIFGLMKKYLSLGEGKDAIAKCQSVYRFDIMEKKGTKPVSWVIDLKNGNGDVTLGEGENDAHFIMTDADFEKVCMGELNPQIAFMQGQMKIKGNLGKATKFTPELFPAPTPENIAKYAAAKL
eukprot:CAMPEP_0114999966 /NCGR_PEP_ID=MMETSP0216-20121206/16468_1 /TAXON_ID=223996 /ORGANISM="Protocruzia adherens, Strain Boccale" /LENGTH=486 /DNA_ID=CAMNT_0002364957 /DNA_START=107 /DNA_END=1567 /DNA_ORIENTATION=-